jgi:CelD/BcsL family acetyltransferase involved in cellulose biosynthesis
MHVLRICNAPSLGSQPSEWNELAGDSVFRSSTWLTHWWAHYGTATPARASRRAGSDRKLEVLAVFPDLDSATEGSSPPLAILPAYIESTRTWGACLRLLGDGEVCSEHLGILARPQDAEPTARALAAHLAARDDWDALHFENIAANAPWLAPLVEELRTHDCLVEIAAGEPTWSISLPADWEEFLQMQSKSHRKQLRRLEKNVLQTGQAVWHPVQDESQFEQAWDLLIDLHQRRRQSLGEPGCFASPRWAAFHREAARALLIEGRLRLAYLELEGRPAAAEYHLCQGGIWSAYQGGLDPQRLAEEPGRLSLICTIQQALSEGCRELDLLRGAEPYKAHWRAEPRDAVDLRAAPWRRLPRLRHTARSSWQQMGRMLKHLASGNLAAPAESPPTPVVSSP